MVGKGCDGPRFLSQLDETVKREQTLHMGSGEGQHDLDKS